MTQTLRAQWDALLEEEPKLRIRDAAARLDTGEAQLLATQIGETVTRLRPEFQELFEALPSLGKIMASTRNQHVVIEKTGVYDNVDIGAHVGLVLDEDIDLRLFMGHFAKVFAVEKPLEGSERVLRSIQFFGKDGLSLHKVYLKNKEGLTAYRDLVERFAHEDQGHEEPWEARDPRAEETPDAEIDVEAFQQAWLDLQDTHEFFGMLRSHGVTRTQALRLAPEGHANQVSNASVEWMLEHVAEQEVPIMAFVGSPGCIEIHTGPVRLIKRMGDWINVLDPTFNLHFDERGVSDCWIVRKPTEDGVVTSLEVFDAEGKTMAMFFGKRKPGIPEDPRWREVAEKIEAL